MDKYILPNPEPKNVHACHEQFADALVKMLSERGGRLVESGDIEVVEGDLLNKPGLRCIRFIPHGTNLTETEDGQEQWHHYNIFVELGTFPRK
ncbi:hypothetical protein ACFU99_08925 [Streptomyces sp. NPDC057654]|uniref:hypothetical protein n=1 Tax=Streptomyces sp. NPDC057654 TaxID=3346196 RepID=UPI0036A3BA1C